MAKIRKEEKLPSCEVTFDLLNELEKYFFNELPNNILNQKEYLTINYSILIEDNFGTEEIKTINDYLISKFTDSTGEINLSLQIRASNIRNIYMEMKNIESLSSDDYNEIDNIEKTIPYVSIDITFRKQYEYENLKISFDGENARSYVVAIYDSIMRIINTYKNNNYLYNPSFGISISFFYINIIILLLSLSCLVKGIFIIPSIIGLSINIIYLLYIIFAKRTHPYFLFECKKSEKYKRWNNWFLYNVLFIVLVNIILILLRKFNYLR